MKKIFSCFCCLLPAVSFAQLHVSNPQELTILSNTTFSVDSLVLIPSSNLSLDANTFTKTATPVQGNGPVFSINRVYNQTAPVVFTGSLGFLYNDGEMGTNTESQLQIAYKDQNGNWITTATSTVNTATNSITYPATAASVSGVTAVNAGVVLPVGYQHFKAYLASGAVNIELKLSDESYAVLQVESSTDGKAWQYVTGQNAVAGQQDYLFLDRDLNFSSRLYRIALISPDGRKSYTTNALVRNGASDKEVYVSTNGNTAEIHFRGLQPSFVNIVDMNGRVMVKLNGGQSNYIISGLASGMYIAQFEINGTSQAKRFVLP